MKKFAFLAMAMVAGMMTVTSCSDDNKDDQNGINRTFDDANGLTLTVNGAPMVGKTAKYVSSDNAATITLNSTFDLSAIPGLSADVAKSIAGPGVIPGSAETVLNVAPGSNFSGSGDNAYCTWQYNGEVSKNALKLNITNLELKNKAIAGKWTLKPYDVNEDWESDEYGTVYSEPVYAVWESSANFDFLGSPMPMNDLLRLLMTMPLLDDMSVRLPDALTAMLRDVTFGADGNITATYADDENEAETPVYVTSPSNMAQYVLTGSADMRLFLNPQAIVAADNASRAEATMPDMNNLLGNVIAQLAPMMSEGLPMHYTAAGNDLTVYLGTETLLPLLKTNVVPLLRNEALVNMLVELIKADESMAFLADMIPGMIASAADVIDGTTKLEIGLNLKK